MPDVSIFLVIIGHIDNGSEIAPVSLLARIIALCYDNKVDCYEKTNFLRSNKFRKMV